ncbi:methyltransferase [Streptomyces roseolilacinus]|uniref:Methyltransferase n=1 Tax=Streptomyces roseolilacinus TaxID=66904 RepID=A0A918EKT3_9ACTN|nr:methyltransferase [Streptomyces roseolilacinus]GGQ01602.1 methyltransferase [Streptomyces roseolilacinus]
MANTDVQAAGVADRDLIVRLAFGSMAAQTLRAAVRLGVVELMGDTPRRAADVAGDAGAEPQPMTRLLRALTGLGLLREHAPGTFSVTPAGALLDPGRPDSLTSFVRMFTEPAIVRAWEHLDGSIRTGEVAFDAVFGTDFFSHLAQHPELSADFNAAMSQAVSEAAAALPYAFDFDRFTTVTDVGGGDGTLLAGVLAAHPGLTGTVFDTAQGLAEAPKTMARHGVEERCSLIAGDFFRSVPEGSDLYMMKSVLHDWTDDQAVTILSHCREVLPAGGLVLIVEPVLPEVVDTSAEADVTDGGVTYLSDLNMLVNLGGRERTRRDFEEVCHRAGLSLTSVTPLTDAAPFSLIEAVAGTRKGR